MGTFNNKSKYYNYTRKDWCDLPQDANKYFTSLKYHLRSSYKKNFENKNNLLIALEEKSFEHPGQRLEEADCLSWSEHLEYYLEEIEFQWAKTILSYLRKEPFLTEKKYQSLLFYQDYQIRTMPKNLKNSNDDSFAEVDESDQPSDLKDQSEEIIAKEEKIGSKIMNNFIELSVTDNLGGSFLSIGEDELQNLEPAEQKFHDGRKKVRDYVRIISIHISENIDHPIGKIISVFGKEFSLYINDQIKQTEKMIQSEDYNPQMYEDSLQKITDKITRELQNFILELQTDLKLFYYQVFDFECFEQEKDELLNLITGLVFKSGRVYESVYSIYDLSCKIAKIRFEEKFEFLQLYPAQDFGIPERFCLNDKTLELQKDILNKKKKEKDEAQRKEGLKENEKEKEKEIKNKEEFDIIVEGDDENEGENDDKVDELIEVPFKKKELNTSTSNFIYGRLDSSEDLNKSSNEPHSELYTKEGLLNTSSKLYQLSRNTVNHFNTKTKMFPKLHKEIRDSIMNQTENVLNAMHNLESVPKSYATAVMLLKSIKKYRTPFEKMLVIASMSDEIMECVNSFWKNMEKYIKSTYLNIEADELMTIFCYIVIKSKMTELLIFIKMIKNFTPSSTRGTTIGYYYATLEASIEYIDKLEGYQELIKNREPNAPLPKLPDLRVSLAELSNLNFTQEIRF